MKKITTLFFWLVLPLSLLGQELDKPAITYSQESTAVLAPLLKVDADLYKNGILYDRVMPLANLRETGSIVETHTEHFKHAWKELYNARLKKTDKHIAVKTFQQVANHYQKKGVIPVGIINIDFTQFTTTILQALEKDKTTINKLANRNRATSNSPYENKHLFLASPIIAGTIKTTAFTPVNFKAGILGLNQAAQSIKKLEVIYNNTTKTIIQNTVLTEPNFSFNFASSGIKTIQFKATFSNGKQLISNAKITIKIQHVLHKGNTPSTIVATQSFKGYDEPNNCNGTCYGTGEYQVFLGKNNTKLRKPLIILDGFDPGDERKIDGEKGSIRYLINNAGKEQNMQKFYDAGFDVVILNFPKYYIGTKTIKVWLPFTSNFSNITTDVYRDGGADYVERNANVLKALITELNGELQQNGSTEKLKIIGPSMGGLISRVALTQMEKANENHNTDIWVSFDSPHLGANIPIGLQYFFNYMELDQVNMLKTPAARQMLLTQVVEPSYVTRKTFRNLLNNLGFPKQTRNLALINGSISGVRQGTPKGTMLDLNLKIVKTLLGSLGRYKIKTFASHDDGKYKIFERYKRALFFKSTHSAYLLDNSGRGSLDNAPGGSFDMINEFESALGIKLPLTNSNADSAVATLLDVTDKPAKFGVKILTSILFFGSNSSIYLNMYQGTPAFIPTKSALAFNGKNKRWSENLSNRNLVCTKETPFNSYFAPRENEPHVTLNSKNMEWLTKELKGIPQKPFYSSELNNIKLSGSNIVCDESIITYNLNIHESCSDLKMTWSVSDNIEIISYTNNSIKIRAKNTVTTPYGYVRAEDKEHGKIYNKGIWVGVPNKDFLKIKQIGSYVIYNTGWSKLKVAHFFPDVEYDLSKIKYHWSVPNSSIKKGGNSQIIDINPYYIGELKVGVRLETACGFTAWKYKMFTVKSKSSSGGGIGDILEPVRW